MINYEETLNRYLRYDNLQQMAAPMQDAQISTVPCQRLFQVVSTDYHGSIVRNYNDQKYGFRSGKKFDYSLELAILDTAIVTLRFAL